MYNNICRTVYILLAIEEKLMCRLSKKYSSMILSQHFHPRYNENNSTWNNAKHIIEAFVFTHISTTSNKWWYLQQRNVIDKRFALISLREQFEIYSLLLLNVQFTIKNTKYNVLGPTTFTYCNFACSKILSCPNVLFI